MKYAAGTSVSSDKSRAEIEQVLSRYGASKFAYGWDLDNAMIGFEAHDHQIRFVLPLPDKSAAEFWKTPGGRHKRTADDAGKAWEQSCRQRWRALALVIKAKLEAVESGITVFEDEFLAHIVMPNGRTVGDWSRPQIQAAYQSGRMPKALLPAME
jgi:hypothetical protein